MEQLLHYVWKHKMFPLKELETTDGKHVDVIDTGLHNRNAGPDFFNAKVCIDRTLWVGNVEIHDKSSDWYLHGHDKDSNYDNVRFHLFSGVLQIYSVLQKKSLYLHSISTRNAASHFSSAVEQRIRNAQVGSSNLPSGSINLIPDKNTLPECLGTLRSQDDAIVP